MDSQEQAAQGAGPKAPVGGQKVVRVRGWARGGFGVRSESVRRTAADKVHAGVLRDCFGDYQGERTRGPET